MVPWGLCCTNFGDILVNVHNGKKNKILRYEELEITQEIEKDEKENRFSRRVVTCSLYALQKTTMEISASLT